MEIQRLLNRNVVRRLLPAHHSFLQDTLGIPLRFVESALALQRHAAGDYEKELLCHSSVGDYAEAHAMLMKRVANKLFAASTNPSNVVDERADAEARRAKSRLLELLSLLSTHADAIPEWEDGGKVYFEYLQLSDVLADKARCLSLYSMLC